MTHFQSLANNFYQGKDSIGDNMSGDLKWLSGFNEEINLCTQTMTSCAQQHCEAAKRRVDRDCQKWKVTEKETGFTQSRGCQRPLLLCETPI